MAGADTFELAGPFVWQVYIDTTSGLMRLIHSELLPM